MLEINEIIKMYDEGKSIRDIAKIFSTYPNKIARSLKKAGKELRNKEDAAKAAVESGRLKPPTLGKTRTDEEKAKIGAGRAKQWALMSEDAVEEFKKNAQERWNSQTPEEKSHKQQLAGEALRKASTEGSKAEKYLYEHLTKAGYNVIMHKVGLIPGEKYEIDLYLPDLLTAIEIDGPQHFIPVFGEKSLQRAIKYDAIKSGALITRGFCVIRVKYLVKHVSAFNNNKLLQLIKSELQKIESKFPDKTHRLIEVELSND
jgi:very-short-patch-repair endonuclease